jgi:signal transduction histidine kinase
MGFAAVARVTEQRWIACGVRDEIEFGLRPRDELKIETTICNEIRSHRAAVAIDDVEKDGVYCGHPTPALYGFKSYTSVPIILPNGEFFGTLCAIDPRPARVNNPATIGMFKLFAELIAFHIDAQQKVTDTTASLDAHRRDAELREQFIAVLGHDLRNPLASIDAGLRIIEKESLGERSLKSIVLVRQSLGRMARLIDDVLDFARGRLGSGIPLDSVQEVSLGPTLFQVVDELRESHPDREIDIDLDGLGKVRCDPGRLGQLLSNLVANALTHGAADGPIRVRGSMRDAVFELSVSNSGSPIPRERLAQLFRPFVRNVEKPTAQGLGLGLYIASEIAKAHGGSLEAASAPHETRFTFRMPVT